MASRVVAAAAAAAATSPSPLARLISRRSIMIRRYSRPKVNLWEDPMSPMMWKDSHGCRRFSSGIKEPTDKVKGGVRMWYQRAKNRMNDATLEERNRVLFVYALFVFGTPAVAVFRYTGNL